MENLGQTFPTLRIKVIESATLFCTIFFILINARNSSNPNFLIHVIPPLATVPKIMKENKLKTNISPLSLKDLQLRRCHQLHFVADIRVEQEKEQIFLQHFQCGRCELISNRKIDQIFGWHVVLNVLCSVNDKGISSICHCKALMQFLLTCRAVPRTVQRMLDANSLVNSDSSRGPSGPYLVTVSPDWDPFRPLG